MAIPVTFMVSVLPVAALPLSTVTSSVALSVPEPTFVSSTYRVILPAVLLKPPNDAEKALMFEFEGSVVVNVIDVAGLLPDPI